MPSAVCPAVLAVLVATCVPTLGQEPHDVYRIAGPNRLSIGLADLAVRTDRWHVGDPVIAASLLPTLAGTDEAGTLLGGSPATDFTGDLLRPIAGGLLDEMLIDCVIAPSPRLVMDNTPAWSGLALTGP
ncbi:MAG: hypothetical protein AAF266_11405 [Planctomycetota bacterium]